MDAGNYSIVLLGRVSNCVFVIVHCTENRIYVFREMKLRDLVPNSYIHVSVSYLYIPRYEHECEYWETEHYNSVLEITSIFGNTVIRTRHLYLLHLLCGYHNLS
jgi:hypothetical protein